MYMFCSIRMAMHRTLLLHILDGLVRNLELGRDFGFSTVDVIKAQFHIGAFEKLPSLLQSEGETILSNHQLRRRDERLKPLLRLGCEISRRRPTTDLNRITGD